MSAETNKPDFDSIRQFNEYNVEFWSARDLSRLLGYKRWENFEVAVKRGVIACQQIDQTVEDHFRDVTKPIRGGKGAVQTVKDYLLSRFACYLVSQNGDPRKLEIAEAQAYFAVAARENELYQLIEQQNQRVEARVLMDEGNKEVNQAARRAGVLPRSFGLFHRAGYEGLYGGLGPDEIKKLKGIDPKEDLLDRMGLEEMAANNFRATQITGKLRREGISGQASAINAHHEIGEEIRGLIEKIGGTMPEDLPAEPSIRPLLSHKRRTRKQNQLPLTKPKDGNDTHNG